MTKDKTTTVHIDLGSQSYDIVIGNELVKKIGKFSKNLFEIPHIIIVTDEHVASHYLRHVQAQFEQSGIKVDSVVLPAGEKSKSFETLQWLLNQIFEFRPERKTTLVALGGGVVGDITGFAASILLRGVSFVQIPTTLLSQIDSSVGGKTGINNDFGKNLIGTFYQPKQVLIDVGLLQTLPMRQFLSGFAEVIKYGLIVDKSFFKWLIKHHDAILKREQSLLTEMIARSCAIKADIVAQDEKEKGMRALLNLGHTFGHALESFTGYSDILFHGEAVAIGMVLAANMSVKKKLLSRLDYKQIKSFIEQVGLPSTLADIEVNWDLDKLVDLMKQDKKVTQGNMVFILLSSIGKSQSSYDVDSILIKEVLQESLSL